jgi:Ca2+-binding RTX toxin-like protein
LGSNDQIFGSEAENKLFGGAGNDSLYGGSQDDLIYGGSGNDAIFASEGNNTIYGDFGNDTIYSGSGNDRIDGGTGNDTLWLGGGQDIVVTARGFGVDTINNFQVAQTRIGLSGGLTFNDLRITQETGATLIEIATSGEDLARLSWVQASSLNANSFVII